MTPRDSIAHDVAGSSPSASTTVVVVVPLVAAVLAIVVGASSCGPPQKQPWTNTYRGSGEDAFLLDDDFVCLGDSTYSKVGDARVKNVLGHELDAVAVAQAKDGGEYPVGTIIQLFPTEASVKRGAGFSPSTQDWEFFTLDVNSGRSIITGRGTTDIHNVAGTCVSCHAPAKQFDFACFSNDKCPPLPPIISTKVDPDHDDPRCHPRF